jgi:hypothetical protein
MRLEDGTAVAAKAGQSQAAVLAEAPHQLQGGRRAHLDAQGRLPDGGSTFHRTIRPRKSWDRGAGMGCLPADHNQLYGISSVDSTQPLHALGLQLQKALRASEQRDSTYAK